MRTQRTRIQHKKKLKYDLKYVFIQLMLFKVQWFTGKRQSSLYDMIISRIRKENTTISSLKRDIPTYMKFGIVFFYM